MNRHSDFEWYLQEKDGSRFDEDGNLTLVFTVENQYFYYVDKPAQILSLCLAIMRECLDAIPSDPVKHFPITS